MKVIVKKVVVIMVVIIPVIFLIVVKVLSIVIFFLPSAKVHSGDLSVFSCCKWHWSLLAGLLIMASCWQRPYRKEKIETCFISFLPINFDCPSTPQPPRVKKGS